MNLGDGTSLPNFTMIALPMEIENEAQAPYHALRHCAILPMLEKGPRHLIF